jgi:hypothetical protein
MARKQLTREQIAGRQQKAVQALRGTLRDDAERASEIESMSVEEYAAEKGFQIVNPKIRRWHECLVRRRYALGGSKDFPE